MAAIKITLETLYDILRNERKREDLQKLPEGFFLDVVGYLKEKQHLLDHTQKQDQLFAVGEQQKLEYELRSIQRILKQIYELREKKILDISLNKSKTGSDIIDTSAMVMEEKEFYEEVLRVLDTYRRGILYTLLRCELPDVKQQRIPVHLGPFSSPSSPLSSSLSSAAVFPSLPELSLIKVKVVHAVPRFVWKDMKEYGPFEAGEFTDIFPEVADLLVRKGRAVKA